MAGIEAAASAKHGLPTRADVVAALRIMTFQGIAYADPVSFDPKGDNRAAVIYVNDIEDGHFHEIDQIGGK